MRSVLFTALVLLATSTNTAIGEEATILIQENSPMKITSYINLYKEPDRVGDGTVMHRVSVKNVSVQPIDAYGIGFYIFDAFKRDMGRPFVGYHMNKVATKSSDSGRWEQRPNSAFLFKNHGHGFAYVAIVRFTDGTVWQADINSITRQLEDFEFQLEGESEDVE